MTSKEMQLRGAKNRWANMTPEERSKVMSRVRAGDKGGGAERKHQLERKQEMKREIGASGVTMEYVGFGAMLQKGEVQIFIDQEFIPELIIRLTRIVEFVETAT